MAVKLKLKRMGKIRSPHYRIIVADSRTKRDGRAIEEIGLYNPKLEPSLIKLDSERVQYWLGVGAQPTEPVLALLKVTGDWQKHKGLPGAEGTLKVAEPRVEKRAAFDAALAEVHGEPRSEATTARKKPAKKSAPKADDKKAEKSEAKGEKSEAKDEQAKAPKTDKAEAPKTDKAEAPKSGKADSKEEKSKADKAEDEKSKAKAETPKAEAKGEKSDAPKAEATDDTAKADEATADETPAAEASTDKS